MGKAKNFFKKIRASILQLLGSLVMLMIAAVIGIMIGLNKTNNIDKYVNEAVEYFKESNWTALFQYAEVIDNDFINEMFFEQLAEAIYGDVEESTVVIDEIVKDDDEAYADISYKTSDGKAHSCRLYFSQKEEKNYLFFNKWKLDIDKTIIRESKITVPAGFDVYMDGVQLTRDNAIVEQDETKKLDVYTIRRLFRGEHTLYLQKEGLEVVEAIVTWNDNQSLYEFNIDELQLVQSQIDIINGSAQDIIMSMYSAIFSESGITETSQYFKQDEATSAMLTAVYDNMLAAITPEDGSTLNSIEITSFSDGVIDYTYPNQADITLSFECAFTARGPRSSKGGVREKYEGTTASEIKMHFIMDGDNWLCDNLNMTCIDYSKQEEAAE